MANRVIQELFMYQAPNYYHNLLILQVNWEKTLTLSLFFSNFIIWLVMKNVLFMTIST